MSPLGQVPKRQALETGAHRFALRNPSPRRRQTGQTSIYFHQVRLMGHVIIRSPLDPLSELEESVQRFKRSTLVQLNIVLSNLRLLNDR